MADNTDLGITVEAWAKIVIERWERRIIELKINNTGTLLRSFQHFINTNANGDPDKITFAFEYYGKFVDMGTGRGTRLVDVGSTSRKPKPWYSKVFWSQYEKLKEIMANKYGEKGKMEIITGIESIKT